MTKTYPVRTFRAVKEYLGFKIGDFVFTQEDDPNATHMRCWTANNRVFKDVPMEFFAEEDFKKKGTMHTW